MKRFHLILVSVFLALCSVGEARDRDINLWPLLTLDSDDLSTDLQYLIPLGRIAENESERVNRLFPFHLYKRHLATDFTSLDLLWPLFNVTNSPGEFRKLTLLPFQGTWEKDGEYLATVLPLYWQFRDDRFEGVVILPAWWVTGVMDTDQYRMGVAPLFWSWNTSSKGFWFAPVLSVRDKGSSFLGILPVWARWKEETPKSEGFWFMPVYWHRSAGDRYCLSVVPIYWQWQNGRVVFPIYWENDSGRVVFPFYWQADDHQVLFPLYWSLDYGKLFFIFPFYGRFRGVNESWTAIMLPAYLESTRGDYKQKDILWPLIHWGSDEKTRRELSFFPFYSQTWKENYEQGNFTYSADETRILLFQWGRNGYSYKEKNGGTVDQSSEGSSLFPFLFLRKTENRNVTTSGSEQWVRDNTSTTVFPFFWKQRNTDWEAQIENRPEEIREDHSLNLFPFLWSGEKHVWKADSKAKKELTDHERHHWVLPLYTFNEDSSMKVFTMLWPLWLQTDSEDEDSYAVLLKIAEASFRNNGDRTVSVLWRGYRDEIRGEQRKISIFPFISHKRTAPDNWRTKFLEGFFEIGAESGDNYFRILYLPRMGLDQ